MKRINKIIFLVLALIMLYNIQVYAHGSNITGWNDKNSTEITEYKGKYYGYHKQNEIMHYHQVEWNEENQKWEITKTAVCYDENFNIINKIDDSNVKRIEVKYSESVDGDTAKFELDGKVVTVRFLGIDTPETVHPTKGEESFGKDASNYTKEKLENAIKIELQYDENASEKDVYERPLVWVWIDGSLLQKELISNGLARTYMLQDNYRYAWILQEEQEQAQVDKVGIWSTEAEIQENEIVESVENKNAGSGFIGLIIIVISLIVVIVCGRLKQKNKYKKRADNGR